MSGHSKWSTIKHRKGAQDKKRGKIFSKIIKEITLAARNGGGDPTGNPRLRRALDDAHGATMPADNVDRAIKKGTGELEGVAYEELVYEGVGRAGTLLLMEVVTDNRNRTAQEIRKIFDKHDGQLGAAGSAAWAFEHKGVIKLAGDAASEEQLFEVAVGAGAEDLVQIDGEWIVTTPRDALDGVRSALDAAKLPVTSAALAMIPKTMKIVDGRDAEVLVALVEVLEDHDDVQNVFTDFELSADALAKLEASA